MQASETCESWIMWAIAASHAVHWRHIKKIQKKNIKNSNTENINWKVTIVNKCLTLNGTFFQNFFFKFLKYLPPHPTPGLNPSPKMSAQT